MVVEAWEIHPMLKFGDLRRDEGWFVMSLSLCCEFRDVSSLPLEFDGKRTSTYTVED